MPRRYPTCRVDHLAGRTCIPIKHDQEIKSVEVVHKITAVGRRHGPLLIARWHSTKPLPSLWRIE
jgi:hypothetical protein